MKIAFLIDGFNLYHSARQAMKDSGRGTKWLNLKSLCRSYLPEIAKHAGSYADLDQIYYFSALAYHVKDPGVVARHKTYIRCLKDIGVEIELSRFKPTREFCPLCRRQFTKHIEKETDVAISSKLIRLCFNNEADAIIIITGDTDIAPAVKTVQHDCTSKLIGFIFPYERKNRQLEQMVPLSFQMDPATFYKNQLPDPFILSNGTSLDKPASW